MKQMRLTRRLMLQFVVCVILLLLVATPAFYWLTKEFYAEDVADLIKALQTGKDVPSIDIEKDIIKGIMLQFCLIICILGVSVAIIIQLISSHLWRPFDKTLEEIEAFNLESDICPTLPRCDIEEFSRLNIALTNLMKKSIVSYHSQKEFVENASHEMQTPLAIFRSKLDILLQSPNLTENQAFIIQDLYKMNTRLSRLNRNLLLLARIDNNQYDKSERIDMIALIREQMPYFEDLASSLKINMIFQEPSFFVTANCVLLESMITNLVVNAIRHNKANGEITIAQNKDSLTISNTSNEPALKGHKIFNRFYRRASERSGNGLGLSIVKAICDYHNWKIEYSHDERNGLHCFTISFPSRIVH